MLMGMLRYAVLKSFHMPALSPQVNGEFLNGTEVVFFLLFNDVTNILETVLFIIKTYF